MASKRIHTVIKLVVIAGVGYFIYSMVMPPKAGGFGPQGPAPVGVAEVVQKKIRLTHEYSGRLVAADQAEIRPRVSGVIDSVHIVDGATVKQGDTLFTIDPRPYQAAFQAAQAKAALAESQFARAQRLFADKAIPQSDIDQKRNDVEVARADLTRAKLDLEYTQVRSPITGRVSRAEVTKGNVVNSGGDAPLLATVVTYDPIYADFEMDEATYMEYARAHATTIDQVAQIPVLMGLVGDTGTPYSGHIQSFDNRLNAASGTVRVRSTYENHDGVLVPGLFAHIKLGAPSETDQLLITDRAIGTDQNKKFVLVVGDDNKAQHREVKLGGLTDDGLRIVQDGLKPGEKIIVNGTQRVMMPGQEVKPEIVAMSDDQKSETRNQKSEEQKQ